MNIPITLTLLRVIAIPFLVLIYYVPIPGHRMIATIIFIAAAFTDWLDGYLARYLQQTSSFGAFLDPVADKLLVAVVLVLVVAEHAFPFIAIPAAIIVGREIIISGLREWMADIGKRASVAVTYVSKIKTAIQMIALALLLLANPQHLSWLSVLGYILLIIAALLTLWTMVAYLRTAWPDLAIDRAH